ncbi:solute carrier family 22 member 7-like isoform X1 [Pleurodeles waltl]|uniref:solute carrier family 22 member 7-like isoform X1 n=1 Tax=Pleurodeles waltl TaxID=8319 RepID=UPI0037099BE8
MKFEDLFSEVDGFGRFQIRVLLLLCIPRIIVPWQFLLHNFLAAVPPHRCALQDQDGFGNLTEEELLLISIPKEPDGTFSSCKMYREPQWHLLESSTWGTSYDYAGRPPNTTSWAQVSASTWGPRNASSLQSCQHGWAYDHSQFTSTIATQWDLVCNRKWMNQASASFFFMGVTFGAIIFGYLSDRYGRRNMLLVSFLVTTLFAAISAGASSYSMFAVARTICGMGLTGMIIIAIALVVEWTDVKHRTFCGTISSIPWTVGNMSLALLAFLIRDWRWLLLAASSPCVLAIIFWWWIPESARWLLTQQRAADAHRYLSKCATVNGKTDFPSKTTPEMLQKKVKVENRVYFYWDLVKTRRLRRITLWAAILWFGVPFTYYGISFRITGFSLNPYLTHFIFGIIEIPAKVGVYLVLDHIGRRHCQGWSLILAGSSIAVNMAIPTEYGITRSVIAILGKGFSEAAFTTAFLYTAELYPTVLRQTGLGLTSFVARLASAMAPLMMLFEDFWVLLPSLIFSIVALLCGSVAFLLPETTHVHLPETIEDVEGDSRNSTACPHNQHEGHNAIPLSDMCQEEGACRGTNLPDHSSHSKEAVPLEGASCVNGALRRGATDSSSGSHQPVEGTLSQCEQSSRSPETTGESGPKDN